AGKNVLWPRSQPSTNRVINDPADSQRNHNINRVFTQPGPIGDITLPGSKQKEYAISDQPSAAALPVLSRIARAQSYPSRAGAACCWLSARRRGRHPLTPHWAMAVGAAWPTIRSTTLWPTTDPRREPWKVPR